VSDGVTPEPTTVLPTGARRVCLVAAALVLAAALMPPLAHLATRYELGRLLRYALLALVVPPLVVLAAPWGHRPPVIRLAAGRARHPELIRAVAFVLLSAAVMVWWFTPAAADAASGRPWLTAVEALTLVLGGIGLWLELVASPPLAPRAGPFPRAVLGAVAMWLVWVEAYLVGLAHGDWYRDFHHTGGQGLSAAADQEVAATILWFVAAVVFVPVIFLNALQWLRSEEDPDDELYRLMKEERRRARPMADPPR
jgi:cytochrome c oxidase assembly factor CtaG